MHHEKIEGESSHHLFTFEGWEIAVLRAAYLEAIVRNERTGNPSSTSDFDIYVATFPKKQKTLNLKASKPTLIAGTLTEFAEHTDEAVLEIAHAPVPAHENEAVILRRRLGEWAASLAKEVLSVEPVPPDSEKSTPLTAAQVEEMVSELETLEIYEGPTADG